MNRPQSGPGLTADALRLEVFRGREGQVFVARGLQLELIEVRDDGHRFIEGVHNRSPFALLFRGQGEQSLSQGTFALRHEELGEFRLFLTPVLGGRPDERLYESIFN